MWDTNMMIAELLSLHEVAHDADAREKLISKIEGYTGTLESVPYSKITTEDLQKILDALQSNG
jgi:hypothetical protein